MFSDTAQRSRLPTFELAPTCWWQELAMKNSYLLGGWFAPESQVSTARKESQHG